MPEGPSIVILREEAEHLSGMRITQASGTAGIDMARLRGQKIVALRTWGKHFLIEFAGFSLRVHLLLFGSYRIDARREGLAPRLSLRGARGEMNFYACAVRLIEDPLDTVYDWRADIMADAWDPALARRKLAASADTLACDALLDQDVFAGAGNIIKNEVLFRVRVHPLSLLGVIPAAKRAVLVRAVHDYAFDFLAWKKAGVLKRHLQAHSKTMCPRCEIPLEVAVLGKSQRRAFFCNRCQQRYGEAAAARPRKPRAPRAAAR